MVGCTSLPPRSWLKSGPLECPLLAESGHRLDRQNNWYSGLKGLQQPVPNAARAQRAGDARGFLPALEENHRGDRADAEAPCDLRRGFCVELGEAHSSPRLR